MIRTSLIAPCCAIACCFGCDDLSPQGGPEFGTSRQALSIGTARWEQKTLSSPPARMGHALVYDAAQAVTIAARGAARLRRREQPLGYLGVGRKSWASLAAGMPARGFITGTYDSVRSISSTYGGLDRPGASPLFFARTSGARHRRLEPALRLSWRAERRRARLRFGSGGDPSVGAALKWRYVAERS